MRTSQEHSGPSASEDQEAGRCGRCVSAVSGLLRLVARTHDQLLRLVARTHDQLLRLVARTGCSWVFLCVWGAAACLGVLAIAIIGYKWC